jgi:hypothetical protein
VLLLTVGAVLLVDLTTELVRNQYFPSAIDVQRELDRNLGDGIKAAWGDEDSHGGAAVAPLAVEAGADGAAAPAPAAAAAGVAASPALVLRAVSVQDGRGESKVAPESASSRTVARPPLGVVVLENPLARGAPASPSSIAVVEVPEAAAAPPALAPIKIPALPPPVPMPPRDLCVVEQARLRDGRAQNGRLALALLDLAVLEEALHRVLVVVLAEHVVRLHGAVEPARGRGGAGRGGAGSGRGAGK